MRVAILKPFLIWKIEFLRLPGNTGFQSALDCVPSQVIGAAVMPHTEEAAGLLNAQSG